MVARVARLAVTGTVLAANSLLLIGVLSCQSARIPANTREVAPGVYHHAVELIEGPWAIHVIEVDLARAWRSGIRLRAVRAQTPGSGLEKTSAMAENAIAGVNGDFFYGGNVTHTAGLQIHAGALVAQPRRRSAFGITSDGRPVVDVFRFEAGLITASGRVLPIPYFNREPSDSGLTFYNRYAQTWQDSVRAAAGYQLQSLGKESVLNDTVAARVIQVRRQVWPLRLGRGEWLVAAGAKWAEGEAIAPGDTVELFCLLPPVAGHLEEAIGGGPRIIRDGLISIEYAEEGLGSGFAEDRHPRTAVGYSQKGETLFLVTVDGRQPGYSVGMSLEELADLMARKLGFFARSRGNAYQAINLDGGGSTTMVVQQQVVNRPSDQTGERAVANALVLVAGDGRGGDSF